MVSPETYSVEYVHTDALGSPVSYTSSTGSVLPYRNTRYEPYGTPTTTPRTAPPTAHVLRSRHQRTASMMG